MILDNIEILLSEIVAICLQAKHGEKLIILSDVPVDASLAEILVPVESFGMITEVKRSAKKKVAISFETRTAAEACKKYYDAYKLYVRNNEITVELLPFEGFEKLNEDEATSAGEDFHCPKAIVYLQNFWRIKVSHRGLFNLFGIFGRVTKIVIHVKEDKAWIYYREEKDADKATKFLQDVVLWSFRLHLVTMTEQDMSLTEEDVQCQEFDTDRPLCINNPSAFLQVENIPTHIDEDDVVRMFSRRGSVDEVKNLGTDEGGRKIMLKMSSVSEALDSLMEYHDEPFPGTPVRLIISFGQEF